MWTTRSFKSSPSGSTLFKPSSPCPRESVYAFSEYQPGFAGPVRQGLDPPMVKKPVPVEHHPLDIFLDRLFPDPLPYLLRGVALVEVSDFRPEIRGERGCRKDGGPRGVDHQLGVDVLRAAEDGQPRALFRTEDPL